jgi:serine/threonine-protein kinase
MTLEQVDRICAVCDRFDRDWGAGRAPSIEETLAGAPAEDRPELLGPLLRIEIERRDRLGERPTAEDYVHRFPEAGELIEEALRAIDDEDDRSLGSVGRYVLIEEIGRGSEGVVYRAREEGLVPHEVAVKVLPARAFRTRDDAARFIREVRSLETLQHRHIVRFLGSGEDRGQLYYVMEHMASSLARRLKEGPPIEPADAAEIMISIVEAIVYLHRRGEVHFDLKPQNILIDADGEVYVADFGLARMLHDIEPAAGGARGTLPYIAPEQFDSRFGDVGPACDLYSLGVILYQLLTGRTPFRRSRSSILSALDLEPVPPSRLSAGIPHDLERICLKCLRKSTADRYPTAGQLLEDLRRVQRREPLPEPPEGHWRHLVHWAKSEPELAARLGVVVAASALIWAFRLFVGRSAPLADHWASRFATPGDPRALLAVEAVLVWATQGILVGWGLASWLFQWWLNRTSSPRLVQFAWRVVDVAAIVLIIYLDDALMSPLTVAFAVLIASAALWNRPGHIVETTILSTAGYCILALLYRLDHPDRGLDHPYRHLHYLAGLACLCLILAYQAGRTRALLRICVPRDRA